MGVPRWRLVLPALILLGEVLVPRTVFAQAGVYATPSFSLGELYNDNIFYTSSRPKGDFISRFSPGILAGYESSPWRLLGGYTFDAEVFAHRSDLNNATARQRASLDFSYLPVRALTLSFRGEFLETLRATELNLLSGVGVGRRRARRFLADPSITYRFDPLTTGVVDYTFTQDEIRAGITTDSHMGRLGLDRRITPRDTGGIEYIFREFLFDKKDARRFYAIVPGWTHDLTARTSFTFKAGPRFAEGDSADPEVLASIRHGLQQGEISLTYARTVTTAIAVLGPVRTDSVSLGVRYRPLSSLELGGTPTFYRNKISTSEVKVYGVRLDATYGITSWLSLVGSYEYRFQKGAFGGATVSTFRSDEISNNIALLSLVTRFRTRLF